MLVSTPISRFVILDSKILMEKSPSDGKTIDAAYIKSVDWSIEAIESLHEEYAYKVKLPGFPIDKAIATTIKEPNGEVCCKFFLEKLHDHTFNQNPEKFGIHENIILESSRKNFLIKGNSISKITLNIGEPQVLTTYSKRIQKGLDEDFDNKILRLVIPIEEKIDLGLFEYKSVKINQWTKGAGLIDIKVKGKNYHLFTYENDDTKKKYCFIDGVEQNLFIEFKKNTKAIILGLGFITGNLYQKEYYYQVIQHDNVTFVENISFELQEKSIISNSALFNPFRFKEYVTKLGHEHVLQNIPLRLSTELFSKLCEILCTNETIARCTLLILEGNQSKFILLRASIYSLALETLTNVIYEENKDKINPIADKKLASKIFSKMKDVLNEYSEFLSDSSKNTLESKINDMNKPTNSKKLSIPFELVGIKLKKEDLEILNHRNKFLHGTSPFGEKELSEKEREIVYITKRFHFMINCLLLKYVGYRGHIVNYSAWHQLNEKEKITDHLYQII